MQKQTNEMAPYLPIAMEEFAKEFDGIKTFQDDLVIRDTLALADQAAQDDYVKEEFNIDWKSYLDTLSPTQKQDMQIRVEAETTGIPAKILCQREGRNYSAYRKNISRILKSE